MEASESDRKQLRPRFPSISRFAQVRREGIFAPHQAPANTVVEKLYRVVLLRQWVLFKLFPVLSAIIGREQFQGGPSDPTELHVSKLRCRCSPVDKITIQPDTLPTLHLSQSFFFHLSASFFIHLIVIFGNKGPTLPVLATIRRYEDQKTVGCSVMGVIDASRQNPIMGREEARDLKSETALRSDSSRQRKGLRLPGASSIACHEQPRTGCHPACCGGKEGHPVVHCRERRDLPTPPQELTPAPASIVGVEEGSKRGRLGWRRRLVNLRHEPAGASIQEGEMSDHRRLLCGKRQLTLLPGHASIA